jgi:hypothetical protein
MISRQPLESTKSVSRPAGYVGIGVIGSRGRGSDEQLKLEFDFLLLRLRPHQADNRLHIWCSKKFVYPRLSMLVQEEKRKRKSGPKARTGCKTCKYVILREPSFLCIAGLTRINIDFDVSNATSVLQSRGLLPVAFHLY